MIEALNDSGAVQVVWTRPVRSARLEALLDDAERRRLATLQLEDDRRRFVGAHALTRLVIAQVTGIAPEAVTISARCVRCGGAHGRPQVVEAPHLQVSLSHAGDRVAVAVTTVGPVGVDVELIAAAGFAGFADVALTEREREEYESVPVADRPAAAATWWVRKEAIVKATGHGLVVAAEQVEVTGPADEPRLTKWRPEDPPAAPVHMVDLDIGAGHVGCLAVISDQRPSVRLNAGGDLLATPVTPPRTTSC